MIRFIGRRLVQTIPVLFLASIAIWAMIYLLPGDPAQVIAGDQATQQEIDSIRQQLGLGGSPVTQYFLWLRRTLTGNLGVSYFSGHTVASLLVSRIPATVQLAVASIVVGLLIAVPVGMLSGLRPNTIGGRIATYYQNLGLAIPTFWLGILLILAFSIKLPLLPGTSNYVPIWSHPVAGLRNIALPAITLGINLSSVTGRFIASAIADVMPKDYIRMARSKGLRPSRILTAHAMRNALLPIVTIVGLQLGTFLGGTVVTEVVFNYPGLGRLIFSSVEGRDYAVVQGSVLFVVCLFLLLNVIVDAVYMLIDPRIRRP